MSVFRPALVLGACSLLVAPAATAGSGSPTRIVVNETEMAIGASSGVAKAGKVTFVVRNSGKVIHELVIVRWNGNPAKLPHTGYKVPEGGRMVGEVPDVEPGATGSATFTLTPGRYVLICNIVGHYQLGMVRSLIVR
jgi:uncharacterized cupredoxin-like copper-binding protein